MIRSTTREMRLMMASFGEITFYFSFALLIPLLIALFYQEGIASYISFIIPFIVTCFLGWILKTIFSIDRSAGESASFTIILLAWILIPLLGATPFMIQLGIGPENAYFESVSALTTTGLTVLSTHQPFTNSLYFWRSIEAWIGGAGIIVLALIGLLRYPGAAMLFKAEGREERLRPHVINTVKLIWKIYAALTALGMILLMLTGIGAFDSLNFSMSAISTTGMVGSQDNLLHVPATTQAVLSFICIMGAMPFIVHYRFLKREFGIHIKNLESKLLIVIIALASFLILPSLTTLYGSDALRITMFHVIGALTNGGFAIVSIGDWDNFSKLVLSLLMIIGGGAGSTAGGIKLIRLWIYLKSVWWKIKKYAISPHAIISRKVRGTNITDEEINMTTNFIMLYLLFLVVGIAILQYVMPTESASNVILEVTSAQGNAGLTSGITSITMPLIAKLTLITNMIIGRIEIYPLIAMLGFILKTWRR